MKNKIIFKTLSLLWLGVFLGYNNYSQSVPFIEGINLLFPGCTDPMALNYNEEATEDDGTCVYSIGPDPVILNITVTDESCQEYETGVLSSYVYEATIVNIGNEAVTNFCLSDFLGTTFNCFNGVSNLAVWIQPGDTITVTGNINSIGTWVEGQGNYMTVTSVPGEVITGNNNFVFYMPEGVDCVEPADPEYCDTLLVYVTEIDTLIEYVELPADTVTVLQLDTLYIPWEYYFYDTVYVDVFDTIYVTMLDTVIITEIDLQYVYETDTILVLQVDTVLVSQIDTLFQEVVIYEYIYQTDTVLQVVYDEVLIDCGTGLPCIGGFSGMTCESVFIPNAFSPNNDGINDTFYVVSESYDCWLEWQLIVYNRWGTAIWSSDDPQAQWYGQAENQMHYVSDGVYVWTLRAKGATGNALDLSGSVTVFR